MLKAVKDHLKVFVEDNFLYKENPGSKALPARDPRIDRAPSELLGELKTRGFIALPGLVPSATLKAVNDALEAAWAGKRPELKTRRSESSRVGYIDNPLRLCPEIPRLALDPFFLALIEAYFQNDAYLAEVDMRRVEPVSMEEFERLNPDQAKGYSAAHWHYDMRGRQLKMMVYLTDVRDGDQNFAFCEGTHRDHPDIPRSRLDYAKSRFPEGWPEQRQLKVVEAYGAAGTLMLFDTNAVHRLRRKASNRRDSITFYYTPGQQLRALDYDARHLIGLPELSWRFLGGKRP